MNRRTIAAALAWGALLAPGAALAQAAADYPNRPVRMILPYAAGNGADVLGRLLAEGMGKRLKQTVYVENRGGASGTTGTQAAAMAPADGYTIALGGMTTHTLAPAVFPKLRYDPIKSFDAVGRVGLSSIALLATPDFPANNIRELTAHVKANPSQQYASWGNGSTGHFCGEVLNQQGGIRMTHISFGSTLVNSLLGGHIKLGFIDMASATPLVREGKLKALAVCTERSPSLPQVASYKEQGIDFAQSLSWGMYAPAGTPKPMLEKISAALRDTLQDPEVSGRMLSLGIKADFLPGDDLERITARDIPVWRKIAEQAQISLE